MGNYFSHHPTSRISSEGTAAPSTNQQPQDSVGEDTSQAGSATRTDDQTPKKVAGLPPASCTRSHTKNRNPSTVQEEKKDQEEDKGDNRCSLEDHLVADFQKKMNFQEEKKDQEEEVEVLPIAGGAEGLALFVSQGNLKSGWVSAGSDVMQQVFNQGASEVTSLFVVQDCILAIIDKQIHVLCTYSKVGWFTGASIKAGTPTTTTLDVPDDESVLGVQWHESIFVIWTEETGKVYSYAYKGNGNFSNANLIPFSKKQMAAVGIRSNESFYGIDRDLLESDEKATLHFDPPKPEGTATIEIPACRIEAFAASGNAYYPIKAHNKKGEAFIYAIRPDANGVEGLITGSLPNGTVGEMMANESFVYAIFDKPGDENHGKLMRSTTEQEVSPSRNTSKLDFLLNEDLPCVTKIATPVVGDFVVCLSKEEKSLYRTNVFLENPEKVRLTDIASEAETEPIRHVITMGASKDLVFVLAKVGNAI